MTEDEYKGLDDADKFPHTLNIINPCERQCHNCGGFIYPYTVCHTCTVNIDPPSSVDQIKAPKYDLRYTSGPQGHRFWKIIDNEGELEWIQIEKEEFLKKLCRT